MLLWRAAIAAAEAAEAAAEAAARGRLPVEAAPGSEAPRERRGSGALTEALTEAGTEEEEEDEGCCAVMGEPGGEGSTEPSSSERRPELERSSEARWSCEGGDGALTRGSRPTLWRVLVCRCGAAAGAATCSKPAMVVVVVPRGSKPMVVVLPRWHSEAVLLRHCCPARTDDVCSAAKPVARSDSEALVRRCCPPTEPTEDCSVVSAMPRAVYVTISCRSEAEMSTSSSSASMPAGTCLAE